MLPPHRTEIQVRFREVDAYGVAWHGHYLDWMESARNRFAAHHGFDLAAWAARGYRVPMIECHLYYRAAARFDDTIEVEIRLADEPRRAIAFEYVLRRPSDSTTLATARTVQVLQGPDGGLLLTWPAELEGVLASMRAAGAPGADGAEQTQRWHPGG